MDWLLTEITMPRWLFLLMTAIVIEATAKSTLDVIKRLRRSSNT